MLDYNTIENKPTIKMPDGTKQLDLLAQTFNGHAEYTPQSDVLYVTKYYVARPDLISLVKYGDEKYADIICKVNGISNPFEINEGMTLLMPDINILYDYYTDGTISTLVTDNTTTVLDKSSALLNSTSGEVQVKTKADKRSPNDATINDVNYILNKALNLIVY